MDSPAMVAHLRERIGIEFFSKFSIRSNKILYKSYNPISFLKKDHDPNISIVDRKTLMP